MEVHTARYGTRNARVEAMIAAPALLAHIPSSPSFAREIATRRASVPRYNVLVDIARKPCPAQAGTAGACGVGRCGEGYVCLPAARRHG